MTPSTTRRKPRQRQRGTAILEFAMTFVFLIPLLVGSVAIGLNVVTSLQVTQIARDAGHMYARFVDFSLASNKNILVRLASGLNMTADGGQGVIHLTKVTYIGDADCTAAGLNGSDCVNRNSYVMIQRQTVGNGALFASALGTPGLNSLDGSGNVLDYLRDSTVRVENFAEIIELTAGEFAFVSEAWFRGVTINLAGMTPTEAVYARSIF